MPLYCAAHFSWSNGSRLYYANLAFPLSANPGFKGASAAVVSRTDNPEAAAAGYQAAWMEPVIVSPQPVSVHAGKPAREKRPRQDFRCASKQPTLRVTVSWGAHLRAQRRQCNRPPSTTAKRSRQGHATLLCFVKPLWPRSRVGGRDRGRRSGQGSV